MERGAPLTGRVTDTDGASRRGYVTYSQRRLAPGAPSGEWTDQVRTDAEGRFRFESVPLGPATVSAHAGGEVGRATVDAVSGTEVRLVVTPSADDDPDSLWWPMDEVPRHPLDAAR
jgi:hypothetical protein